MGNFHNLIVLCLYVYIHSFLPPQHNYFCIPGPVPQESPSESQHWDTVPSKIAQLIAIDIIKKKSRSNVWYT